MNTDFFIRYDEPLVCTAIHNGHDVSERVKTNLAISDEDRLREEDPLTEFFTRICNNRIIVNTSRFEVDLNRSRNRAVYLNPEDAWGLITRKKHPSDEDIEETLKIYDTFYRRVEQVVNEMISTFGCCFVWDIHSYNHHRLGTELDYDDPEHNPEIILGTSNMSERWLPLVDNIKNTMTEYNFFGKQLDVRINVKFPGGHFSRWLHHTFGDKVCSVAIEFKKIFMDEWTGLFYPDYMRELREVLQVTKPVIKSFQSKHLLR